MITVTADHLTAARDAHRDLQHAYGLALSAYQQMNFDNTLRDRIDARKRADDARESMDHAEGIVDALAWVLGEGAPYGILNNVESSDPMIMLRRKLTGSSL